VDFIHIFGVSFGNMKGNEKSFMNEKICNAERRQSEVPVKKFQKRPTGVLIAAWRHGVEGVAATDIIRCVVCGDASTDLPLSPMKKKDFIIEANDLRRHERIKKERVGNQAAPFSGKHIS